MVQMRIDLYLPEKLQQKIEAKWESVRELDAKATAIGSTSSFTEKVLTSPKPGAPFEEAVLKKAKLEEEIERLSERQAEAEMAILRVCWQLEPDDADILRMRHIDLLKVLDIAHFQEVSYRTVQRRLKKARRAFNEAVTK